MLIIATRAPSLRAPDDALLQSPLMQAELARVGIRVGQRPQIARDGQHADHRRTHACDAGAAELRFLSVRGPECRAHAIPAADGHRSAGSDGIADSRARTARRCRAARSDRGARCQQRAVSGRARAPCHPDPRCHGERRSQRPGSRIGPEHRRGWLCRQQRCVGSTGRRNGWPTAEGLSEATASYLSREELTQIWRTDRGYSCYATLAGETRQPGGAAGGDGAAGCGPRMARLGAQLLGAHQPTSIRQASDLPDGRDGGGVRAPGRSGAGQGDTRDAVAARPGQLASIAWRLRDLAAITGRWRPGDARHPAGTQDAVSTRQRHAVQRPQQQLELGVAQRPGETRSG